MRPRPNVVVDQLPVHEHTSLGDREREAER